MKTLQQVVTEIKGHDVSTKEAKDFALNEFAQVYAWIKADVVANLLEDQKQSNQRIQKDELKQKYSKN